MYSEKEAVVDGTRIMIVEGKEYEVKVRATFVSTREGHDADGNRSWAVTYLEDIEVLEIDPEPLPDAKLYIEEVVSNGTAEDFMWEDDYE